MLSVSSSSAVIREMGSCNCAKGHVVQLRASALQKTHTNNAKKEYTYVLEVRRSDGSEYKILRNYYHLVGLQNSLPQFKELVVEKKLKKNEIPRLSDRVERTKDLSKITKYFESLIRLQGDNDCMKKTLTRFCQHDNSCDTCRLEDGIGNNSSAPKITGSQWLLNDISSPMSLPSARVTSSYKSSDKRQLNLQQDTIVQIYKKCPTGWWYVICRDKSGWFPASYLQQLDGSDINETEVHPSREKYKAERDYEARHEDELSFTKNATLVVILKNMDGWWIAEHNDKEGYVPATYLRPCEKSSTGGCDMCQETLDMKPTRRRCCSECAEKMNNQCKEGDGSKQSEIKGVDNLSEEDIIRDENNSKLHLDLRSQAENKRSESQGTAAAAATEEEKNTTGGKHGKEAGKLRTEL